MNTKLPMMTAAITLLASATFSLIGLSFAQATTFGDGGFEAQGLASNIPGSYCYGGAGSSGENNCGSGAWSFATLVPGAVGDGIIAQTTGGSPWNSSAWGAPIGNDPSGYFAFVQINGSFSQTFTAAQTGNAVLNWIDAARSFGGTETYTVSINSLLIGTYSPTNSAFAAVASSVFSLIAGDQYTLTFQGVDPSLTDSTAFIDDVSISYTPLPATLPLFAGGLGLIALIGRRKKRKQVTATAVPTV
jgi:hypothetical protein